MSSKKVANARQKDSKYVAAVQAADALPPGIRLSAQATIHSRDYDKVHPRYHSHPLINCPLPACAASAVDGAGRARAGERRG